MAPLMGCRHAAQMLGSCGAAFPRLRFAAGIDAEMELEVGVEVEALDRLEDSMEEAEDSDSHAGSWAACACNDCSDEVDANKGDAVDRGEVEL